MERLPHDFKDFKLVFNIEKLESSEDQPEGEPEYYKYVCILSKKKPTPQDKSLVATKCCPFEIFELPEGEVYDPPEGIRLRNKLFNDAEMRRARREEYKVMVQYQDHKYRFFFKEIQDYYAEVFKILRGFCQLPDSELEVQKFDRPERVAEPGNKRETTKQQYEVKPIRDLFASREKNGWKIGYPGTEIIITKNLDGLFYINYLLQNPHKEIRVGQLYQSKHLGHFEKDKHYSGMGDEKIGKEGLSKSSGLEMELIDDTARKQYKERLGEIKQDLAEAERNNDQSRIEELSDEKEKILQQLDSATSITGMDRGLQSGKAKTYRRVRKAFIVAISNIRKQSQEIADYLLKTITTGYVCIYKPLDPDNGSKLDI